MNLVELRKKFIKKLKENKQKGNIVLVPYSGGKDSHLAVIKLIERGYYPILIYISLGKKNMKRFKSPDVSKFLKDSIIPEIKIFILSKDPFSKTKNRLKLNLIKKFIKQLKENVVNYISSVSFYLSDNELVEKDIQSLKNIEEDLIKEDIKTIRLSNLIKKNDIFSITNELKKYKIEAIIINADKSLKRIIGKKLNQKLIKMVIQKTNINEPITNQIQTFVYKSPIINSSLNLHNFQNILDQKM